MHNKVGLENLHDNNAARNVVQVQIMEFGSMPPQYNQNMI